MYVRNLEERVKPEQLKDTLHAIFSEYGNVIDVVAKTNLKAKGQAFVVFDDPDAAARAIDDVQGFEIFDKPMVVALARSRSDATVLRHGTEDEFEVHKRRRMAEKGTFFLFSSPPPLSPGGRATAQPAIQTRKRPSRPWRSRSG